MVSQALVRYALTSAGAHRHTGKTVLLFYVLLKRLLGKDATLVSPDTTVLLFEEDATYSSDVSRPPAAFNFGFDVWFLFDIDAVMGPPPVGITGASPWPVQATSPNEARFKQWKKQRRASTMIMNPWSEEELRQGYVPLCYRHVD